MAKKTLQQLCDELAAEYGPQDWWPADSRPEVIIGAVLTQNTAWINVEKALSNLRKNSALNFQTLKNTPTDQLINWIRPAGTFNQKAGYLKAFISMLQKYSGSLDRLFELDTPALRKELLAVKGIGPETADSILLYAAERPVFVVDAYARRLLDYYGYQKESKGSYDSVAKLFTDALPADTQLYNETHARIVLWGKDHSASRRKPA